MHHGIIIKLQFSVRQNDVATILSYLRLYDYLAYRHSSDVGSLCMVTLLLCVLQDTNLLLLFFYCMYRSDTVDHTGQVGIWSSTSRPIRPSEVAPYSPGSRQNKDTSISTSPKERNAHTNSRLTNFLAAFLMGSRCLPAYLEGSPAHPLRKSRRPVMCPISTFW